MRQGCGLTRQKTLLLCACVHVNCSEGSATAARKQLWSGKSADAADVTGIPCFVKMRWRFEMGKSKLEQLVNDRTEDTSTGSGPPGFWAIE